MKVASRTTVHGEVKQVNGGMKSGKDGMGNENVVNLKRKKCMS